MGSEDIAPQLKAALRESQRSNRDRDTDAWKLAEKWYRIHLARSGSRRTNCRSLIAGKAGVWRVQLTKVMVTSEGLPHMKHHADGRGFPHFYTETHLLNRGDVQQKQEIVAAGFLQALTPAKIDESHWVSLPPDQQSRTSFRRATLANWMTDAELGAGALVARVIVNRVWQHHFGRGLGCDAQRFWGVR